MLRLRDKVRELSQYFADDFNNPRTTRVFFKALILLTLAKIVMLWSFSHTVMTYHSITLPRSWVGKILFAPSFLANHNVDAFYTLAITFLVIAFLVRPHYITTIIFFWLTFNLYVVYLPYANGANFVLFMLALWCIPQATRPTLKSETWSIIQIAGYNTGVVLCQLQVVFIYLISGWDKLIDKTWQSGEAFDYITHLNTMFNPTFTGALDNPGIQLVLSWITILFELAFVVLVWFDKTRLPILAAGVLFHLFIWIVMSLPDFASVMIISYIRFLKDTDYDLLRSIIKR